MLAEYGFYLLLLAFVSSLYGSVAALASARLRHRRLFRSARLASHAASGLALSAALLLWYMFYTRDYSVAYVFRNSSQDLPLRYTISAFWGALEGSHFLWTLLLAIVSFIAHRTYTRDNEHIMPYVSATLQAVLCWMFYLAVRHCDPFAPQYPAASNGLGLNALLQNPYMVFHPPSLFCGYTACAVPFAYSLAALCYGDITEGWLRTTRRWALIAWTFLTIGIFLGGRWAYVELGWAGYWAWDPVENSSFLPWLFTTGLLHSLIVQEKLGHMKRFSLIMAFLAFFFSFFGTFVTRSGIISSVHSFAQSPIGPNYLYFLVGIMSVAILLYAYRAPAILPADVSKIWGVSKESALVITQFIILIFGFIIFMGTLYPVLSELVTGSRFNVQAPYFNTFAPYIGFSLVIALTIGNLLRFHSGKLLGGKTLQIAATLLSLPLSAAFIWRADVLRSHGYGLGVQIVGIFLCFWSLICLSYDAWSRIAANRERAGVFFRQLSYWGALFAHAGLVIAILGFLGNYRGLDTLVTLKKGESTDFYGYHFEFPGMQINQVENVELYSAPLELSKDGTKLATISPARAHYPTKPELLHEIGLHDGFWYDIYIVLSDFARSGDEATFQIHINPTVKIVWISVFFLVLGGLLALLDRARGIHSRDFLRAR